MSKKLLVGVAFSLILATGVFAQSFTVSYLDGVAELQASKAWQALSIGDPVPANATVRVSQNGSLELERAQVRLTILKDGTYDVAALAKAASKGTTATAGGTLTKKLQTLVTERPKSGTVGGVRAGEQGSTGAVMWVDESDETRTKVQALLDQKQYSDALKVLNQAISDGSSDLEPDELTYLTGVAYYGAGQTARAWKALSKIQPKADSAWYARYIILTSQVLVDTQNYQDALGVLAPFIAAFPAGEATQMAWLLDSYSQKGLGNAAAATSALDAGYKLDPASETAKLIAQQRGAQ